MTEDSLMAHARRLWTELAAAPAGSPDVAVSSTSRLCPPGWAGIVVLGGRVVATAPEETSAETLRRGLAGLTAAELTDPEVLRGRLPIDAVLGPATLAYCDTESFRPDEIGAVDQVAAADLAELAGRVSAADAGEAGLDEITSAAFVLRSGDDIVAAAGFRVWPLGTAHLSVLTVPEHRGRGLARRVASAAVAEALGAGLIPQWRARPEASRRVARAVGFREAGTQLGIRLGSGPR
jgi:GNAT superfamily N-acetyltransferase